MDEELARSDDYENPILKKINFEGLDVLEIGSGYGGFTFHHLTRVRSLLGIDPDSPAIHSLQSQREKFFPDSQIEFLTADITNFPLPSNTYDIAVFPHSF